MLWQNKRQMVSAALQQIGMTGFSRGVTKTHSDWMLLSVLEWARHDIVRETSRELVSESVDPARCVALQDTLRVVDDAIRELQA